MTTHEIETVKQIWPTMAPLLFVPQLSEYTRLVHIWNPYRYRWRRGNPSVGLIHGSVGGVNSAYEDEHVAELI